MQAIQTKYLGPTNHRGARLKASCQARTIVVGWDYALGITDNHEHAAMELAQRLGWTANTDSRWVSGALKDGSYAHVCVP